MQQVSAGLKKLFTPENLHQALIIASMPASYAKSSFAFKEINLKLSGQLVRVIWQTNWHLNKDSLLIPFSYFGVSASILFLYDVKNLKQKVSDLNFKSIWAMDLDESAQFNKLETFRGMIS